MAGGIGAELPLFSVAIHSQTVRVPADAVIADDKLTRYLLVRRQADDKSQFLARGGYTAANADALRLAILELSTSTDARADGQNEYGTFWRIEGELLPGADGDRLSVVLIWMKRAIDGRFHFVTLKPLARPRAVESTS